MLVKMYRLTHCLSFLKLDKDELIACGDGMNDISMIRYAGLGVAMENAYPKVKEAADYIAPANDDNGVAKVIENLILLS